MPRPEWPREQRMEEKGISYSQLTITWERNDAVETRRCLGGVVSM